MKYKLIVSDFDGTMANSGVVSQTVINAINKYRSNGGKFVMCTGRARSSADNVIKRNGICTDGVISLQGATAEVDDKIIVKGGLPKKIVHNIVVDIHKFGVNCAIWEGDYLFYENDPTSIEYLGYFKNSNVIGVPLNSEKQILDFESEVYGKIIVNRTPANVFSKLINFINEKYGEHVVANSGAPGLIEVVSKNYTKYATTKRVAEYLGYTENEVITIGDSTNDLTLLEYGFGIAVENADEELKKVAKYVAPSVENDGLAYIIEKVLNNEL
jgi:Cof subfamily protein (haloacid dehalogenase superfamily)